MTAEKVRFVPAVLNQFLAQQLKPKMKRYVKRFYFVILMETKKIPSDDDKLATACVGGKYGRVALGHMSELMLICPNTWAVRWSFTNSKVPKKRQTLGQSSVLLCPVCELGYSSVISLWKV